MLEEVFILHCTPALKITLLTYNKAHDLLERNLKITDSIRFVSYKSIIDSYVDLGRRWLLKHFVNQRELLIKF